jgi:hypothetical protein
MSSTFRPVENLTSIQREKIEVIRSAFEGLEGVLRATLGVSDGCFSPSCGLAHERLVEASMWAVKAITHG